MLHSLTMKLNDCKEKVEFKIEDMKNARNEDN